jgi:L-aminopeptidase/D-esterase-like protein
MSGNILDVDGIKAGHAQDHKAGTGVTVVLAESGAVAGVDVRGGAPGTRETDLLHPLNTVQQIHAVVLSGGSAFGLAAADGVMQYLEEKGIGFETGYARVPIVVQAVLYDLNFGDPGVRPDRSMGYAACLAADCDRSAPETAAAGAVGWLSPGATDANRLALGAVGAGCGATVGKIRGQDFITKSGIGSASVILPNGLTVAALIAVNALGDIVENGRILAGALNDTKTGWLDTESYMLQALPDPRFNGPSAQNTTIGVVATNARLDKSQINKVAAMSHDGLARSIRPVHTSMDGDTLFALATGAIPASADLTGILAARVVEQAVFSAIRSVRAPQRMLEDA